MDAAKCAFAETEAMLKASLSPKEDAMLVQWRAGYDFAFPRDCSPRLHVVTGEVARATTFFSHSPRKTGEKVVIFRTL